MSEDTITTEKTGSAQEEPTTTNEPKQEQSSSKPTTPPAEEQEPEEEEEEEEKPWRTVCISNLSDSLKEDQLRDLFKACGEIEILCIKLKLGEGRVCYIRFNNNDCASTALLLNDQTLDSKPLQIKLINDDILANYKEPIHNNNNSNTPTNNTQNTTTNDTNKSNIIDPQVSALETVHSMSTAKKPVITANGNITLPNGILSTDPIIRGAEEEERQEKLSRTIYVGNLNPMIQSEHLSEFFSVCGVVNLVKIAGNSTNPQAARYGFVEFSNLESARSAYNLSGHFLLDRPIKIGPAKNAILNPHPSKANIITNPVKINHAMAKVRLLQQRIQNRYVSKSKSRSPSLKNNNNNRDKKIEKDKDRRKRSRSRDRDRKSKRKRSRHRDSGGKRRDRDRDRDRDKKKKKKDECEIKVDKSISKRNDKDKKDKKKDKKSVNKSRYSRDRDRDRYSSRYGRYYSRSRSGSRDRRSRSRSRDRDRKKRSGDRDRDKKKRDKDNKDKKDKKDKDKKHSHSHKKNKDDKNKDNNKEINNKNNDNNKEENKDENNKSKGNMLWDGFQWHPAPNINVNDYRQSKYPPHLLHNKQGLLNVNSPNIQQAAALAACGTKLNTKYPPNPMNACPLVNPEIAAACAAAAASSGKLTPQQATILKLATVNKAAMLGNKKKNDNKNGQTSSIMAHQLSTNAVQQQMNKFFPSLINKND